MPSGNKKGAELAAGPIRLEAPRPRRRPCLRCAVHGLPAWWLRRTYYLFQMPRWDRRLRIVLDWTVALFFRPDITRIDLRVEREQAEQAGGLVEKRWGTTPAVATTSAGAAFPQRLPGSEGTLSRNA